MTYKRNRLLYGLMIIIVVILGLLSRKMGSIIPDYIDTYLGDALWALLIYIAFAFVFRVMETKMVALLGISFCYIIELSQLYHAHWIDNIRRTTLGGLVLGYGFLWSDLVAYAIGIGAGIITDILFRMIVKNKKFQGHI